MKTKSTKSNTASRAALVTQLRTSAAKTIAKNKDASPCAIIRALSKALPKAGRAEFHAVFGKKMSPHTVDRQFYIGRS